MNWLCKSSDRDSAKIGASATRYDLPDLITSIRPRPVTIAHPVDALGEELAPL